MSVEPVEPVVAAADPKDKPKPKRFPPHQVVLHNDDVHAMDFVVHTLQKALGMNLENAMRLMFEAHTHGRAVVWTGTKEVAELKAEQIGSVREIRAGGVDHGPLGCHVEPVPGG